jgi:hypothetical protein
VAEIHHLEHAEDQRQPDGDGNNTFNDKRCGLRHQTGGAGKAADYIEVKEVSVTAAGLHSGKTSAVAEAAGSPASRLVQV